MGRQIPPQFLRRLRNDIPIEKLIAEVLEMPWKYSEGYFRFMCPICTEFNTATKPETNLARCFRCKRNLNPIDMVMTVYRSSFLDAVKFLKPLLPYFNRVN